MTLQEAAEKYYKERPYNACSRQATIKDFISGAEYRQAEIDELKSANEMWQELYIYTEHKLMDKHTVKEASEFLQENGIDPKEEARYGHEEINRLHAIADFCKIFDKFRTNPFKASLMHYLETGTISGNMALAVGQFAEQKRLEGASAIEMANRILKTPDILSPKSQPKPDSGSLPKEGDS
jgi:hypothetical protein